MQLQNFTTFLTTPNHENDRRIDLVMSTLDRIHELLRKKFNGKQKQLAEALGVSEAAVSKLINGYQNFSLETIVKLEIALGEPILAVVTDENDADYCPIRTTNIIKQTMQVDGKGLLGNSIYKEATGVKATDQKTELSSKDGI
jgi:transcriptional regulator with XRE-family HTH domain